MDDIEQVITRIGERADEMATDAMGQMSVMEIVEFAVRETMADPSIRAHILQSAWQDIATRAIDSNDSYLVTNAKGQVAPWIRGVIHNNGGSPWDWEYGEAITKWQPLPLPPTGGEHG